MVGMLGYIGLARQYQVDSPAAVNGSLGYFEALSESITTEIDRFEFKNIYGGLYEPDDMAGIRHHDGDIEFPGMPRAVGNALLAVCGDVRDFNSGTALRKYEFSFGAGYQPTYELSGISSLYFVHSMKLVLPDYTGPLVRIRETGGSAEKDIYPDASLWANAAEMWSFIGAGSGTIVRWYDQTNNGRHATQNVAASQPILNLEARRPTILFTSSHFLVVSGAASFARQVGGIAMGSVLLFSAIGSSQTPMFASTAVGSNQLRASFRASAANPGFYEMASRRLDTDGASIGSLAVAVQVNVWDAAVASFLYSSAANFFAADGGHVSNLGPIGSPGVTDNTDGYVAYSSIFVGNRFLGEISLGLAIQSHIDFATRASIVSAIQTVKP